jgi:trk system potassium uptake protein TrkH
MDAAPRSPAPPERRAGLQGIVRVVFLATLALDLVLAHWGTGFLALPLMAVFTVRLFGRGSLRVRILALLALAFALSRGWIAYLQIDPGSEAERASAARTYDLVYALLLTVGFLLSLHSGRLRALLPELARRPALSLAVSFAVPIAVGALLLVLPLSVTSEVHVSLVDALFMATSAVCVTGLSVLDVGRDYTPFGQAVLLLCIQLGGIGIMTVAAVALLVRPLHDVRERARYAELVQSPTLSDLRGTILSILVTTLLIEAAGTALLFWLWSGDPRLEGRSVLWSAAFHAVSAFCNAGFALFSTSLAGFADAPATQLVLMALVILGGLGFPVVRELARRSVRRRQRLSLTTRVVLVSSLVLVVCGTTAVALLESDHVLYEVSGLHRYTNALFTSVSARTAGFNTLELGAMRPATLLVIGLLMFVGGSPVSTAGGIKTTTAAVLFAAFRGELRGREPRLMRRTVRPEILRRATSVAFASALVVLVSLLALTLTEELSFLALAFESVSAFSTTGLSTGITPELSAPGKLVLVATMFVGRLGPLTVALAVARGYKKEPYRYPGEDLPIG